MKIVVAELRGKLSKLMPGLSGRSPIKDIKHFAFLGDEIVTYNDQVCISVSFKTDFSCSIPADELLSILSSIKEPEIDMELKEGAIYFSSPTTNAQISTLAESQLLTMIKSLNIPEEGWKTVPKEFITAISLCVFSTSKDMTAGALNCVALQNNQVLSSDTFRISAYEMKESIGSDFILIPAVAVKDLIKYPVTRFCVLGAWIHFEDENNLTFSSRILLDDYPNILEYLKLEAVTIEIPTELKEMLDSIEIFTKDKFEIDKNIEIKINKNILVCRAENEVGWIEKKIKVNYKKEKISFFINPVFLSQILEKSTIMQVAPGEGKALFSSDAGKFRHLMALRVD